VGLVVTAAQPARLDAEFDVLAIAIEDSQPITVVVF